MSVTTHLALPHLAAAQAQKHVTHNEALDIIDAIVQLSVESRTLGTPPGSPSSGARYLVPTGATGSWAAHVGEIAAEAGGGWAWFTPRPGWRAFVRDAAEMVVYDGADWTPLMRRTGMLGVNADPDTTNRLSVNSPAALFNHDGSDMRVVLNKAATGDVATMQFQAGFAAKAELGLAGNDDLTVKIHDGAALREAMVVKSGSGRVGIGVAEPAAEFEVADSSGDGDCRIQIRANAEQIAQFGVSSTQVFIDTTNEKPLLIYVNGTARAHFNPNGNVGIGIGNPSTRLEIDGAIKVKSYFVAALPSASGFGEGSIIHVKDEVGGSTISFSDGTVWRRLTDNAIIS